MPKIKFTAKTIQNLKPKPKQIEYTESGRPSGTGVFGIRVSPAGRKAWFLIYQGEGGKQKRLTLGTYPAMSLSAARDAATAIVSDTNRGTDPHTENLRRQSAPTVTDLWQAYQDTLSQRQKPKAATTLRSENGHWKNVIEPALGDMKVEDVKPPHLAEMMGTFSKKSPVSANRLYSLLSVMFKPAMVNGWIEVHPLQWLDKPGGSESPRERVLSDTEIETLWPIILRLRRNPRDQIRLGLLTAQRPGEIADMKWSDVDFDRAIWTQPHTKTGNLFLVPLSPQVLEILQMRKNDPGRRYKQTPSEYVFPSAHNTPQDEVRPASSPVKRCKIIADETGIDEFTPHDLRRTARTLMSRLEIEAHVRERVLNHSQGGIQKVYDRYDYIKEKRVALVKLANEIDRIVGVENKTEKVIKLRRSA